jgi:hypothetical protein
MTIKEARKILGKDAENISDEDIRRDIDMAVLFKDLFFNINTKRASE